MELMDLRKIYSTHLNESWSKLVDAQKWLIETNKFEQNEYFEGRLFKPEYKMANLNITELGEEIMLLFVILKKKYGLYLNKYDEYIDKMNKYIDNNEFIAKEIIQRSYRVNRRKNADL